MTTILYDDECHFCQVIADALVSWSRGGLRAEAIQSAEGQRMLESVPADERLDSFHLVADDGTVQSGGPALSDLFASLPGGGPLSAALARSPRATTAGYEWIALHRTGLSRFVPGALKRRAGRRLTARRFRAASS